MNFYNYRDRGIYMNNKLLISVEIPSIEEEYDLFIPINRKIGTIKKVIIESISQLQGDSYKEREYIFFDVDTGVKYRNNIYVKDSGIKNGARIMLI